MCVCVKFACTNYISLGLAAISILSLFSSFPTVTISSWSASESHSLTWSIFRATWYLNVIQCSTPVSTKKGTSKYEFAYHCEFIQVVNFKPVE